MRLKRWCRVAAVLAVLAGLLAVAPQVSAKGLSTDVAQAAGSGADVGDSCDRISMQDGDGGAPDGHRLHCHELAAPLAACQPAELRAFQGPDRTGHMAHPVTPRRDLAGLGPLRPAAVGVPRSILFGNFRS